MTASTAARSLAGRTLFITGASRGIGRAIALRAARDGANVAIAAKTGSAGPRLPGTVHDTAREVEAAGGRALPLVVDVRDEHGVAQAVAATAARFGGIDILVNNASAIALTRVEETPVKRFDLMFDINVRGAFVCTQACLPHLRRSANPHVLTLAPPLNLRPHWLAGHCTYTVSKYAMGLFALGVAGEERAAGVASNCLWPRTYIATSALNVAGPGMAARARTPEVMADAAWCLLTRPAREFSGQAVLDEEVLRAEGVADFSVYGGGEEAALDLFVDT